STYALMTWSSVEDELSASLCHFVSRASSAKCSISNCSLRSRTLILHLRSLSSPMLPPSCQAIARSALQRPLGRGDAAGLALVDGESLGQRPGQALEAGLGDVVIVLAVEVLHMQGDAGVLGEGLEELAEQLGIHLAELRARERHLPDQIRPARDIDGDAGQRLVHGQVHAGVAGNALLVGERLGDRLAQDDAAVLRGVVKVDVQIALGL